VEEQQTPEEKLKTFIYDKYTALFSETASDRRQVYIGQIWEKIVLWWNKYNYHKKYNDHIIDANDMGVEIFNVINRIVKDNNETVKNKSEFFSILKKSLKNAENEYFRTFGQGSIHIPRDKKRKLKELNGYIRTKEKLFGRKLTDDEKEQCVSKWFIKQEYIELLNAINLKRLSDLNKDENNENVDLDVADPHSNSSLDKDYIYDPLDNTNAEYVMEAVKFALEERQERARDCYKDLFTLYCIKKDVKELYHILDHGIIDSFHKNGIKPTQYEIYQKYHPGVDKDSAGSMAAANLKEFLKDIETYLKNKNQ